jgi:putative acetyltransferase
VTETRHSVRLGSVAAGHAGPVRSRPPLDSPPRSRPPHDLMVRFAAPADLPGILSTVRAAFGYDLEAALIVRLGREGRVAVSMVAATAGDVVVGHALLSCLGLSGACARGAGGAPTADAATCPALALAPVAVTPEHQRRGIGSALVRATLAAADPALPVFVIGAPGFYQRFGFEPADGYGCTSRFDVPPGHFMVLPAQCPPAAFAARAVEYPPAFGGL